MLTTAAEKQPNTIVAFTVVAVSVVGFASGNTSLWSSAVSGI